MKSIYDFSVKSISGEQTSLKKYEGKVLLIVNVASQCGFTPQYKGLEQLYKKYKSSGFEILAFPCNQFGAQEPGDEQEIQNFCSLNYDVSFPLFAKVEVNGKDADPLFDFLKNSLPGILGTSLIKWNFTKFLVDRTGKPMKRYAPKDEPLEIEEDIKAALT